MGVIPSWSCIIDVNTRRSRSQAASRGRHSKSSSLCILNLKPAKCNDFALHHHHEYREWPKQVKTHLIDVVNISKNDRTSTSLSLISWRTTSEPPKIVASCCPAGSVPVYNIAPTTSMSSRLWYEAAWIKHQPLRQRNWIKSYQTGELFLRRMHSGCNRLYRFRTHGVVI